MSVVARIEIGLVIQIALLDKYLTPKPQKTHSGRNGSAMNFYMVINYTIITPSTNILTYQKSDLNFTTPLNSGQGHDSTSSIL